MRSVNAAVALLPSLHTNLALQRTARLPADHSTADFHQAIRPKSGDQAALRLPFFVDAAGRFERAAALIAGAGAVSYA